MADDPPLWFLEGLTFVLSLSVTMNVVFGLGSSLGTLIAAVIAGCVVYGVAYRLVLVEQQHSTG